MLLSAFRTGSFLFAGRDVPCVMGRGGVVSASAKREGDGATPAGLWPLRRVLYRPDRLPAPASLLRVEPIAANDGWCDDPADEAYNRPVKLPYPARAEGMWRGDGLYDVVVVLGYNDAPVVKGAGSAIFLHCASPGFSPTEGCVAVERATLVEILLQCQAGDALAVA